MPKADTSRLDAIYARIKNLQSFKDEIMGDLEDFTEDFEQAGIRNQITIPEQFEEVVDIVVSDTRQKAGDAMRRYEREEKALERGQLMLRN
jgi:predicted transcriptional regulator